MFLWQQRDESAQLAALPETANKAIYHSLVTEWQLILTRAVELEEQTEETILSTVRTLSPDINPSQSLLCVVLGNTFLPWSVQEANSWSARVHRQSHTEATCQPAAGQRPPLPGARGR